jgi:predicted ATP-grasp superfamily ATP-dependent carboligase
MQTIAVAAISARAMAEAAAEEGFDVVALDLFGDLDTRRAAPRWLPIGAPGSLRIEPARVMDALRLLAEGRAHGEPVLGWVAGSGFEGEPELLAQAAAVLPLIGTAPSAVRRVREPAGFFGFLAAEGIDHPPVAFVPPADPAGWLMKDAHGCGGWHVQRAPWDADDGGIPVPAQRYFQREMPGLPMSATFIANGRDVHVLGFNLLEVRRIGTRPFVFCGATGPMPVPGAMAQRVGSIACAVTRAFELRGLCSLDFMRDGDALGVLEVNPRPPATMSLYRDALGSTGLMRAHLRACIDGELPLPAPSSQKEVQGFEIVFARRSLALDPAMAERLATWPGIHDLPHVGQRFGAGDPLCTLTARGDSAQQVRARLCDARERLLRSLETP